MLNCARYDLMDKLIQATSEVFPDSYLHLGGKNEMMTLRCLEMQMRFTNTYRAS